jgi:hypothetical protein
MAYYKQPSMSGIFYIKYKDGRLTRVSYLSQNCLLKHVTEGKITEGI